LRGEKISSWYTLGTNDVYLRYLSEGRTGSAPQVNTFLGPQAQPYKQWLIVLILVFTDLLLGLLVWEAASVLQSIWGRGAPTDARLPVW
jgi:hypothetical protein